MLSLLRLMDTYFGETVLSFLILPSFIIGVLFLKKKNLFPLKNRSVFGRVLIPREANRKSQKSPPPPPPTFERMAEKHGGVPYS